MEWIVTAGGYLSSSVTSSLGTSSSSSDEEATTSTASGSDTEKRSRRVEETTPRKPKPIGGGKRKAPCTPSCPSPSPAAAAAAAGSSLRSGHVQRALVLPQHFELAQNDSFWDDHNVQVVVRARPISGKEAAKRDFSRCLRQDGPHAISWLGPPETRFTFDHVAGENISQVPCKDHSCSNLHRSSLTEAALCKTSTLPMYLFVIECAGEAV